MKPKKVPMLAIPNGATAPRCQATAKRTGAQCSKPARQGFEVCQLHGAGYASREDDGERQPVGRKPTHGLYARTALKDIEDLREAVSALELDFNNTDEELTTARAVVWFLLKQAEGMTAKTTMLEAAVEAVEQTLEAAVVVRGGEPGEGELTVAQTRQVAAQLAQANKLLTGVASWTDRLMDANIKVIGAVKTRAEIRARLAEEEATKNFVELARKITSVIWRIAPDNEFLDLYEGTLRRELFGPMNLELPEPASD